jgi:hypothetical protein
MSGFRSTVEILKDAQAYIAFKFFSIDSPKAYTKYSGQENLIFILDFRDSDAKAAFMEFAAGILHTEEVLMVIKVAQAIQQDLMRKGIEKNEMKADNIVPIFGSDARRFFNINNLKTLTTILTVQTKLQKTKHAKIIQQINYEDGAM